jgi:glycosyltransferase involved in cell wall biosynthesis
VKRIGIDASAMLIARKNGYENYVTHLILAMTELDAAELEGLDIYLYFYTGNRLADATLLDTLLPRFRRFTCRVYRLRRGFRIAFPLIVAKDRLDWLHLPVHLWSERFPCRVASTFHDACSRRMLMQGHTSDAIRQLEEAIQIQLGISQALIAVSQSSKQDLVDLYGVLAESVQVVHHGVDAQFRPDSFAARQVREFYNLPPYILSVNALQGNKNHIRLLRAFAELRARYHIPQILVLVGRDGWDSDVIYAEITKLQLGSSIRRLGYVPQDHLCGLYAGADLVVNASLCEGFGLPVLEALACGAVVAAANIPALVEIGGDAVSYFDAYSIGNMVATILSALTDPQERTRRLAAAPRQLASFTWKRAAEETLSVYRMLE